MNEEEEEINNRKLERDFNIYAIIIVVGVLGVLMYSALTGLL